MIRWFMFFGLPCFLFLVCSCEKCIDCIHSKFNDVEKAMVYAGRDQVKYTDGTDTISVSIERTFSESDDKECGSFPISPSCLSLGSVTLYHDGNTGPVHYVQRITTIKNNDVWQCTDFQIGGTFFLNCDENYQLTPLNDNKYQINTINNYLFDGTQIGDVREIINMQPLGNVSELTTALYNPELGVLELNYSNPSATWKLVP